MKLRNLILLLPAILILQACSSTTNNTVFWVSGFKTECDAGAGKMDCLNVYEGDDLSNANWEVFYSSIEGFEFEEGYLQKIEIEKIELDPKNVAADASSVVYNLVKKLEKRPDIRISVSGNWVLARIDGAPINKSIVLPTMQLNLDQMRVSGTGGCNNYTGSIDELTFDAVTFGLIASTKKACVNNNIEDDYLTALNNVKTYEIDEATLTFMDSDGTDILAFIEGE